MLLLQENTKLWICNAFGFKTHTAAKYSLQTTEFRQNSQSQNKKQPKSKSQTAKVSQSRAYIATTPLLVMCFGKFGTQSRLQRLDVFEIDIQKIWKCVIELKNLCFNREKLLPPVYDQALRAMQLKLRVNLVKCRPPSCKPFLSPMPLKLLC